MRPAELAKRVFFFVGLAGAATFFAWALLDYAGYGRFVVSWMWR